MTLSGVTVLIGANLDFGSIRIAKYLISMARPTGTRVSAVKGKYNGCRRLCLFDKIQ